jgi:SAM-dependent methyltransferase
MPSSAYTDPRLAACYDSANPHDPADDFYLALAGAAPKTILDMGCGTGRLAVALAARGQSHLVGGDIDRGGATPRLELRHDPYDKLIFLIALAAALLVDLHSPIRFGLLRCLASLSSLVQGRATNAVFAAAAAR